MKQTYQEKIKRVNFEPGHITKDGFLGTDQRHIHDIIQADKHILSRLKVNSNQIAERMQYFIEQGKKGLEMSVEVEDFQIRVQWDRGMLSCPFGERGLHHKLIVTIFNKRLNQSIGYSQLSVHLIRIHHFYGGKGSVFRIEPEELVRILDIQPNR
jgi:hypothetical protein